ncbi:MAG: hypothetical protein K2G67_03690 [Muribaculaceae bacterium]|nr:hypothetical protein [Muribaculaceae bacterium]
MKKIFLIILSAIMTISSSMTAAKKEFPVIKYLVFEFDEKKHEESVLDYRLPQHTVPCSIGTTAGVRLIGEGDVDIISYEIWEIGGMCISEFGNEEDFIEILFKLSGDYEVRFITAEFTYIGIIKL